MIGLLPHSNSSGGLPHSPRDRFISASVSLLEETDEWPQTSLVQRELTTCRDPTSASREAKRLPSKYGRVDDRRVELSVSAFHRVAPAGDALRSFWSGFREAQREYMKRQGPKPATLTLGILSQRAQLSGSQAKQAMMLLASEGLVEEGGADSWTITSAIRHYVSTSDLAEYLRRRHRFERKRSWCRAVLRPLSLVRKAFGGESSPARVICLGALAILLATVVLWLGAKLLPTGSEGGRSDGTAIQHAQSPGNRGAGALRRPGRRGG
jgi:hypothetical protein